jgi:RNase P/RNase MRP subunit p30
VSLGQRVVVLASDHDCPAFATTRAKNPLELRAPLEDIVRAQHHDAATKGK